MSRDSITPQTVLDFWFGSDTDAARTAEAQAALWWEANPVNDELIRARFGALRERAISGELVAWEDSAKGLLALIILVDQFSRNLFRADARAFEYDVLARAWCGKLLAQSLDRQLRPIKRVFAYLPLEHSESIEDQQDSLRLYTALRDEAAPQHKQVFAGFVDFAQRHRDIIERFGRFAHRNATLGRTSTSAEVEFLREPGSSF